MQLESSPFDETLDSHPGIIRHPASKKHRVALIEGSTPALSHETDDLLRRRLRSATVLLFVGFAAFLMKHVFYLGQVESLIDWVIFWDHLGLTLFLGLVAQRLCANCTHALKHLRVVECLVFGGSAIFFLLISYSILTKTAPDGYLIPVTPIWLLLIFTYALFIPNTIRRAALIIGLMASTPVVLMLALKFSNSAVNDVLTKNEMFTGLMLETAMLMTLAAFSAVWGSFTMGTLRREVFEAKQLGQYRLKEQIGEGGMGEVYLAEHVLLKRPSAIKLIRADKAGDVRALARFEREVKATAKLTHWNTVEIYDYGRAEEGTFYYVMEYLPGMNLGQLVELHGPLSAERVIHLMSQTCDALSEAHSQGLIHRDIKPANIFAANRGNIYDVVKLLDFGLAKPLTPAGNVALTMEGTITGSPLYMSPEQATGNSDPDARGDIYSLGAVAYYLLTGEPPFHDTSPIKVMMAHARDEPTPPSQLVPDVPADIEQVVMRCLEKDPDHRFQDAASLQEAFMQCASAGQWTREDASCWWENNGCPKKKALDAAVLEAV